MIHAFVIIALSAILLYSFFSKFVRPLSLTDVIIILRPQQSLELCNALPMGLLLEDFIRDAACSLPFHQNAHGHDFVHMVNVGGTL